jgi:hypothetical protein
MPGTATYKYRCLAPGESFDGTLADVKMIITNDSSKIEMPAFFFIDFIIASKGNKIAGMATKNVISVV